MRPLDHQYAHLDPRLFARVPPTAVRDPQVLVFNQPLAHELGFGDAFDPADPHWAQWLSGNEKLPGSEPLAQAYAGHQFGHFAILGDGRAHLLGEHRCSDGRVVDLHLKGSGPTPFSRRGDGRAALGPMLREYLISEAMAALGIATSRALAVVTTGETVWRDRGQPGAILARIAASHLRVGTFEYAALLDRQNASEPPKGRLPDAPLTRQLATLAVDRHDPDLRELPEPERFARLLERVVDRQARLIAQWMSVGFIHGVMNTDNTTISGETIDYGPCAFMDRYRPDQVFSSIDVNGRYAYANQPYVVHWNLSRLAEAFLPLLSDHADAAIDRAQAILEVFPERYAAALRQRFRDKLALADDHGDADDALVETFLDALHRDEADFTQGFRALRLGPIATDANGTETQPDPAPFSTPKLAAWYATWKERQHASKRSIDAVDAHLATTNPAVIARNHRVEQALEAAETGDLEPFETLLNALRSPFTTRAGDDSLAQPPGPEQQGYQTFCGT